jgi:hypothetical protein
MYSLGKERQIPITCSACHSALMLSLLDFSELLAFTLVGREDPK